MPELNPVLIKELRGRMRGARAFIILTSFLLILALPTVLIYLTTASTVTFNSFNASQWAATVQGLDQVMIDIEQFVEHATDAQLSHFARMLADIATHNAYHTGQILYVRKLEGAWDPTHGVK